MLTPDRAFSICGGAAALSWLGLAGSLFIPDNLRAPIWAGTTLVVPALVGLAYSPPPLSVAHIARHMGSARRSVQRIVDLLIKRHLVGLGPNPHQLRAKRVVLTAAGRETLAAEAAEVPLNRLILDRIGAARIDTALAVRAEMGTVIARFVGYGWNPAAIEALRKDAA